MKKITKMLSVAALSIAAVACGSPEKMAKMAENVTVKCNPAVLEVVGGEIVADVTVTYPEDYFHPKAILEVVPVIVYEGGEVAMDSFMFQGEKVKDNFQVVPSDGATVTKKVKFQYVPGMEKCYLELRGTVSHKAKYADLPSKKVADGANTTYMLVCQKGKVDLKADGYQEIIKQTAEGQILYQINSANVRNNQLTSQSIKDFQAALDEIKANERKTLTGTDIVAYASPDGKEDENAKLSDKRSVSAEKAFGKVTKKHPVDGPVNVSSIAEDWEGFQELVAASDIEDKELIIRVLSMYSDPAVREKEIKNMSSIFKTLAKEVLPELRRARFIANVEFQNYTNEELLQLIDENIDVLDETALLRAATLVKENEQKAELYKKAADKFSSNAAQYNLAVVYLNMDENSNAKRALDKCEQDADWNNAMGVIALREGELAQAAKYFAAAGTETAKENLAVIDVLNGKYSDAAAKLAGKKGYNAALVALLNGNNAPAAALECECPQAAYLRAVAAARQGNAAAVATNLDAAKACEKLAARAAKDIEFAQYR
ncbi:MAG: hypothetical protein UD961_04455 [Bacteroidales bacterium]|nr:hypothetical protein [Bacteroidales bacterium]